jgi:hypothetical protein
MVTSSKELLPIDTKPSLDLRVKCDGKLDECFENLRTHFGSHCEQDVASALRQVFGAADPEVLRQVELVANGGLYSDNESKSFFYKPIGGYFHVHLQGFDTVKTVLEDRDWLQQQLDDAHTSSKIVGEKLNVRTSFKPSKWFGFFTKDILSYLLPFIGLLFVSTYQYLSRGTLGGDFSNTFFSSLGALLLWGVGTLYLYLRKHKRYVFELPEE